MVGGRGQTSNLKAGPVRLPGDDRSSSRDSDREVVELGYGVVVYPPAESGGVRRFRQGRSEAGLAVKLEKVLDRLAAGAVNMERPGDGPDRLLPGPGPATPRQAMSRKHAYTQRRLCERFAVPSPT